MRLNLKVPFAEKDEAKKLGARWDAALKVWHVEQNPDMSAFAKWSPMPHEAGQRAASPKTESMPHQQATGKIYVGADYIKQARVCQCLPWDTCDKCRAAAFNM